MEKKKTVFASIRPCLVFFGGGQGGGGWYFFLPRLIGHCIGSYYVLILSLLEEFGIFAYFLQLICGRIETLKIKEEKFSPKLQFQVTNSQLWLMHFLERTLIHIMPSKSLYLFEEKLYRL